MKNVNVYVLFSFVVTESVFSSAIGEKSDKLIQILS